MAGKLIASTCVVGVAEGRRDALVALVGGVTGALIFTLVYTLIDGPLIKPLNYGKITIGPAASPSAPRRRRSCCLPAHSRVAPANGTEDVPRQAVVNAKLIP